MQIPHGHINSHWTIGSINSETRRQNFGITDRLLIRSIHLNIEHTLPIGYAVRISQLSNTHRDKYSGKIANRIERNDIMKKKKTYEVRG